MCFGIKTPNIQPSSAPEATPTAPAVNGSDDKDPKSKAQGVNALKIPLNVPPAGNGLQIK